MLENVLLKSYKLKKLCIAYIQFLIEYLKSYYMILFLLFVLGLISLPIILDYFFSQSFSFVNEITNQSSVDKFIKIFIDGYLTIAITSIPIILALAYFIYREQQNVSLRNQNFGTLFLYFGFSISGVILAYFIKTNIIIFRNKKTYFVIVDHPFKVIALILFSMSTILFLYLLISKLLRGINLTFQLKNSRNKIIKLLKLVYFTKNNRVSRMFYTQIHNHMESIFQILEYASTNKMDKLFKDEFANLSVLLERLMEQSPHKNLIIYSKHLTEFHPTYFPHLYFVTLRNIGNLTFNLFNNNKPADMEETFDILKSLEPNKVPELYPMFFNAIEDISLHSLTVKGFPFERTLFFLESFSSTNKNQKTIQSDAIGIVFIYQSVLKVATENNDVKKVTAITYSLDTFINVSDNRNESDQHRVSFGDNSKVHKSIFDSIREALETHYEATIQLDEIALYILFQATLKSIEVGSYGATGQLIKRITTDFNGKKINDVFEKFYQTKGVLKETYEQFRQEYLLNDLITDFSFNHRSFEYCTQKLLFLLLAQEALIVSQNISFTTFHKSDQIFISFHFFSKEYLEYVVRKIKSVGNGYGLIFLQLDNFVDDLGMHIKERIKNTGID